MECEVINKTILCNICLPKNIIKFFIVYKLLFPTETWDNSKISVSLWIINEQIIVMYALTLLEKTCIVVIFLWF